MDGTLEHYIDYLLATTGAATATGMSTLFDGQISHDKVTRFLSDVHLDDSTIWKAVKPLVRRYENAQDAVLIVDDTIIQKPHTDENAIICWHYDHTSGSSVKGANLLTLVLDAPEVSLPINVHLIEKTEGSIDTATGQMKYRSPLKKSDITRQMLLVARSQNVQYRYFLADSWFSSAETLNFVDTDLKKFYIMAVKSSRTVALTEPEKLNGQFSCLDALSYPEDGRLQGVYLRSVKHPVTVLRRVCSNNDGSHGILYMVSNDIAFEAEQMLAIYNRRWRVEQNHKALKQHTAIAKSPTKTVQTQANHLFASIAAYVKLERIKLRLGGNHFSIKAILTTVATKAAFIALGQLLA